MTLRPEYSLGHSAYNDFLFAPLGHDAAGTELTVLSALTRLGIDPWQEAARLADLPRAAAASALATAIARLPGIGLGGSWTAADAAAVAGRLVAALPEGSVAAIPETPEVVAAREAMGKAAPAGPPLGLIPGNSRPADRRPAEARLTGPRRSAGAAGWLLWGGLAVAFYLLLVQLAPDREFEPQGETRPRTATTRQ